MKIVHTADVHLSSGHPERLDALEKVLARCEEEDADVLLISGDLFDANVNVEELKTDLRPLFSGNSFQTFVIPGNHDKAAFRKEEHFGDDITVLQEKPFARETYDDVNLVALPYTDKDFSELIEPLVDATVKGKKNVLMIHCTLAGTGGVFGEESEYMPVKPAELVRTGFDYVLAGHIHSSATKKKFGDTKFAYSGSPVSIFRSETGKRFAWMLETGKDMKTVELDTFHYLKQEKEVLPGEEETAEEKILQKFGEKDLDQASLILELSGFTERPVDKLSSELKDQLSELGPEEVQVDTSGLESVSSIVNSEIYAEFREKLGEKEFENPELVEKKFLRALSRYER